MTQEANATAAQPIRSGLAPRSVAAAVVAAMIAVGVGVGAGYFAGSLRAASDAGASEAARTFERSAYPLAALLAAMLVGAAALLVLKSARVRQRAQLDAQDAALARMSWRLDFALAASEIGVWDVDLKTDELMWDARARALFGVEDRDGYFSEVDWVAVLHPDDRDRAVAAANAAVAGDRRFISDYRIVLPSGEIRHIRDMASVFRGADGSHRLVGLIWDVTADVTRQQELELRRAEAEAATEAKSRFLAAMSHEIRTPMTGVLGMLDLMLAEPLPHGQRERAMVARASARSLLLILNDILDFSKLEADRVELLEQAVDPREIVAEVVALMAAGAAQKRLSLRWSASDAVPERIVIDPMRLRQILTNLVSNATKFTETGHVEVRLDVAAGGERGALAIEVEDTGIGIPADMVGRLFEEFVQADDSLSRRRGGTGLGLAISKRLAELMGGRIAVRNAAGRGSVFTLTLPLRRAQDPQRVASAATRRPALEYDPPMRILVAEDNATNQFLIRAYLESRGHTVTTVGNGVEAVSAVRTGAFDVVLMDVQMPELDGQGATRAIRALPPPASLVPVIALTANAFPDDRARYVAAGMNDYISKPIDFNALRDALFKVRESAGS